jgi:hypothetical protein
MLQGSLSLPTSLGDNDVGQQVNRPIRIPLDEVRVPWDYPHYFSTDEVRT